MARPSKYEGQGAMSVFIGSLVLVSLHRRGGPGHNIGELGQE